MKVKATGEGNEFTLEYGDRVVYGELAEMKDDDAEIWRARGLYGFDFDASLTFAEPVLDDTALREVAERFLDTLGVRDPELEIVWDRLPDDRHRQAWIDLTHGHDGSMQDA